MIKLVSFLSNVNDIDTFVRSGVCEAILEHSQLSQFGKMNTEEITTAARKCREMGIRTVLAWDILMVDSVFKNAVEVIKNVNLDLFDSIRVQDPGAINYIQENYQEIPIQFKAERGNNNIASLQRWHEIIGEQLERIILSTEVSQNSLKQFINKINIPFEFLGFGPILLFYSPRKLLAPQVKRENKTDISAVATSAESPNHSMNVVENSHGTYMFHHKDHCILENVRELYEMGLSYLRIDLRFERNILLLEDISKACYETNSEMVKEIKKKHKRKVMRGFYTINRTDAIFKKLKNYRIQKVDANYLGDVLEAKKGKYIAVYLNNPKLSLSLSDDIRIVTPDGNIKELKVQNIKDSALEEINQASFGSLVLLKHTSGVTVRSRVYLS